MRVLTDADTWPSLGNGPGSLRLLGWGAGGLYFLRIMMLSTGEVPLAIMHLDPSIPDAPLTEIFRREQPFATLEVNAATGLVLYQPMPDAAEDTELRLHNLQTNEDVLLARGPFLDRDMLSLAPDGRHVAYLAPTDRVGERQLVLISVGSDPQRLGQLPVGQHGSYTGFARLRWSVDSATLFVQSHTHPLAFADDELAFRTQDGLLLGARRIPLSERQSLMETPHVVTSPDEQRLVRLEVTTDAVLVQVYDWRTDPQVLVAFPLSTHGPSNGDRWQPQQYQLVYIP